MNNSLYTTIPPELEYLPEMTPEEEMDDYIHTFDSVPDENKLYEIDLFRIYNGIDAAFLEAGYEVTNSSRPVEGNPFQCIYGFETPKNELKYLTYVLDRLGVEYTVKSGAFKNADGRLTNKRFAFVELKNGISDYYKIYSKTDEIPYLCGDVVL